MRGFLIPTVRLWAGCGLVLALGCTPPVEKVWQYQSYSASGSTPALAGDLIVFGTESGEVHAVTRTGAFRWKFQAKKEVISAPAVFDNLILFGSTNHNFYAVDRAGRQVWKYTTLSRIKGDPLVVGGTVYFGSYDKHIYALDALSRSEQWVFPPEGGGGEEIEVAVEDPNAPKEGDPAAPAPGVDRSQWPQDAFSYAKPLASSDGHLILGNLDGYIYAVKRDTGELAWRFATDGVKDRKGVTSSVLEKNGVLYFGANDGNVYAVKLADRSVVWKFTTGDEVNSSPALADDGTLYVGSRDKKLYAVDSATGAKKWEFVTTGPILSVPAVYKNLVIFGAGEGDGHVYAVDGQSGKEFWRFKTGDRVDADPVVDGDMFYIASFDKNLYAFRIHKTQ